jgi:tetratricopeptide (TPR) repeat protein
MKKRPKIKRHKDNIFLFPNVDKLLMEKGLDKLKAKRFTEAIEYLEKALELDQDNEEIALGLIIAYFEAGNLFAAKALAQDSLHKGFGDYFQLIDIYIMILLQLNEYEEIVSTIQALIDEREIPLEKIDNFTKILEFSKRKLESENSKSNQYPIGHDEMKEFNLLQYANLNDQFLAIARLAQANVRVYLSGIKEYLQLEDGHPFLKTMLLQLLKEQEVNEDITLIKFSQTLSINPVQLVPIESFLESPDITNILKLEIEQGNPTLYESIKAIIKRHSFLLFPIERNPHNPFIWAASYHFIALEYHGEITSMDKLANKYSVEQDAIRNAILFIRQLEEISSPII